MQTSTKRHNDHVFPLARPAFLNHLLKAVYVLCRYDLGVAGESQSGTEISDSWVKC